MALGIETCRYLSGVFPDLLSPNPTHIECDVEHTQEMAAHESSRTTKLHDRTKWGEGNAHQNRELVLKEQDQYLRGREIERQEEELRRARWTNPLVLAILAAAIAGFTNAGVSFMNNAHQLHLEKFKANQTYTLERSKEEATRILEMIKVSGTEKTAPDRAATNLGFSDRSRLNIRSNGCEQH